MNPRFRLILGFICAMAIAAAMAWHPRGAMPAGTPRSAEPAPPPLVQVERTFVRVMEPVVEQPTRSGRAPVVRAPVRPQRGTVVAQPAISRARRVLFGSGRYRPEPFPRATPQDSNTR